jgi:hypothetical protein
MKHFNINLEEFRKSLTTEELIKDFSSIGVEAIPKINEDTYQQAIDKLDEAAEIIYCTDDNQDTIDFYHDIKNVKKSMETYLFNYKMWKKTHNV